MIAEITVNTMHVSCLILNTRLQPDDDRVINWEATFLAEIVSEAIVSIQFVWKLLLLPTLTTVQLPTETT